MSCCHYEIFGTVLPFPLCYLIALTMNIQFIVVTNLTYYSVMSNNKGVRAIEVKVKDLLIVP